MAFDFKYPTPLPSTKGWAEGWPSCQTQFIVSHPVFTGGVRKEIEELVDLLVYEMKSRGFVFMKPGCWGYGCRATKGGSGDVPSFHSWGLALDINAPKNVFGGSEAGSQIANSEKWIVAFLRSYGFFWLGPAIKDWMHFSFCGSVHDARRMTIKAREELGNVKYEEFEDGVRLFWAGKPEPAGGPQRFGWNMAKRGETKPAQNDPTAHSHPTIDHKHTPGGVQ